MCVRVRHIDGWGWEEWAGKRDEGSKSLGVQKWRGSKDEVHYDTGQDMTWGNVDGTDK